MAGTSYDEAAKLAELRALDQRAGIVKSTVYANHDCPRSQVESWVLYLGPFDTQADANSGLRDVHARSIRTVLCRAVQLDP